MLRSLSLAGLGVLVVLVSVTPAGAQCTGSQVFGHQLGGTLQNCADNGQVSGFVFSLPISTIATAPSPTIDTTNTVPPGQSADFMCEADGDLSQGFGTCVGGAGIRGDGIITIDGNWANNGPLPTGAAGCPDPSGIPGVGRNIMVVRDLAGGGVILSVAYDIGFGGFIAEFADRTDATGNEILSSCHDTLGNATSRTLTFGGVTKGGDSNTTTASVNVSPNPPVIFSDCDPNSVGAGVDCVLATGGQEPAHVFAPGPFYQMNGPCGGPTDLSRGRWQPYTSGSPISFPSGNCLFIGNSIMADGVESPTIAGALSVAGNLAPAARALDVRAKQAGGDVVVTWRTDSEIGLQSFTIQTKSGRQIGGQIAPKGIGGGGASYSVSLKRGDFRNEKSLYVVSATADGPLKSDLASF